MFRLDFGDFSILHCQFEFVCDVSSFSVRFLHDMREENHNSHVDDVCCDLISNEPNVFFSLFYCLFNLNSVGFFFDLHSNDFAFLFVGQKLVKLVENSIIFTGFVLFFVFQFLYDDCNQLRDIATEQHVDYFMILQ